MGWWVELGAQLVRAELIARGLKAVLAIGVGLAAMRVDGGSELLRSKAFPYGRIGLDDVAKVNILGALKDLIVDLPQGWGWLGMDRTHQGGGQRQACALSHRPWIWPGPVWSLQNVAPGGAVIAPGIPCRRDPFPTVGREPGAGRVGIPGIYTKDGEIRRL